MGAITTLVLAPLMAPLWGFRFVLEQLRDQADAVLQDEARNFAELIQLSMRRNAGMLSNDEFEQQETALFERLASIRAYKDEILNADADVDAEADADAYADADVDEEES